MNAFGVDPAATVALVTAIVSFACALAQGPFRDVGWMKSSNRLLDLSDKLADTGAEGRARKFLRNEAVSRILAAAQFKKTASTSVERAFTKVTLLGLAAMMATSVIIIAQTWMGEVAIWVMVLYSISCLIPLIGLAGTYTMRHFRRRRLKRMGMLSKSTSADDQHRRVNDDEDHDGSHDRR